ncbi:hypothetical protein CAPTEDRAFT_223330 [Capitella teleta]|uniref:Nucleolar and spindle-associated protein 1 n=1 Tax=Capitella teleta TaxID=283909 RepID=R7T9N1_CAPTE|nr:hypothetical protein CAPTEDRAFT_223330 [Capitella teleta]|eukprot:ELT87684.1 hypothetical protein CAPTEDRAFT_223330 [Capitella teleta]
MSDRIDIDALDGMKYAELRALAKKHGIRANLKSEKLVKALKEYALVTQAADAEDEESSDLGTSASPQPESLKKSKSSKRKSVSPIKAAEKRARKSSPRVNNPQLPKTPEDGREKRRSTFDVPKEKSRRSTFDLKREPSDGVTEMIEAMGTDMTDEEQKDCLMAALDRKVASTKKDKTGIPRFQALIAQKVKKPITPGNKDWSAIHKRQFDKMESLDEYVARKRRRSSSVTRSLTAKKKRLQSAIESLSKRNQSSAQRLSVKSKAKIHLFASPANAGFVPSVTSTSKISTNFTSLHKKPISTRTVVAKKTPKPSTPKVLPSTLKRTPQLRKNTDICATNENAKRLSSAMKNKTTPFQFKASKTFNLSTADKSQTELSSGFKRKPSYRRHTGALKPFVQDNLYLHQTNVKEVKVHTKEDRQQKAHDRRADRRMMDQMKRRGLAK